MIAQILIPTVELAIPTGTAANEANAKIKTKPLTKTTSRNKTKKMFDLIQISKNILIIFNH